MNPLLQQVLREIEQLTPAEQLEVIRYTSEQLKRQLATQPMRNWRDLRGMAAYPLMGEDAQEWVSRTRRESDEQREQTLRGHDADC